MIRSAAIAIAITSSSFPAAAQLYPRQFEDLAACAYPRVVAAAPELDIRTIGLAGVGQIIFTARPAGSAFGGNPPVWTAAFLEERTRGTRTTVRFRAVQPGTERYAELVRQTAEACSRR